MEPTDATPKESKRRHHHHRSTGVERDEVTYAIEQWNRARSAEKEASAELERCKARILKLMDKRQVDVLQSDEFVATRVSRVMKTIRKTNVPVEVWSTYATPTTYTSLTLSKTKQA